MSIVVDFFLLVHEKIQKDFKLKDLDAFFLSYIVTKTNNISFPNNYIINIVVTFINILNNKYPRTALSKHPICRACTTYYVTNKFSEMQQQQGVVKYSKAILEKLSKYKE